MALFFTSCSPSEKPMVLLATKAVYSPRLCPAPISTLKFIDDINHWKYKNLDLSTILFQETIGDEEGTYQFKEQNHMLERIIDWKLINLVNLMIL